MEQTMRKKRKLLLASVIFFIIYLVLIFKQSELISAVFQSQLPLTMPKLTTILFTPDWIDMTIQQAKRGTILVGLLVGIEILVFVVILIIFLIYFWKTRKLASWRWNDYLIFSGYVLMLLLSLICAYQIISQTWATVSTIQHRLSVLSPDELEAAFNKYRQFLENYTFTLNQLGNDLSKISAEFNKIFHEIKQIRNIPKLITHWLQNMDQWRFYFILSYLISLLIVLVGFLSQWVHLYSWLKNRKSKKDVMNERLLQILEQQQVLIDQLIKEKKE